MCIPWNLTDVVCVLGSEVDEVCIVHGLGDYSIMFKHMYECTYVHTHVCTYVH